ncbi:hypothetical protein AXE80_00720 [Wenyingzhuangia fucanilytica]|uniref:Uncharacterized protein n=1 Tax=Wenyingzhuangia fucanilytica TaxID=1790137 RepID=A0A1B1Y2A7_9FLAO|nr:putative DNA-binding domain-containing protein [Wenyingzhuangia fucanilytica]ANW94903.1 hypothetical protein AXE80_00720 [Wenyingzhuangia fucanilytica]
MLLAKTHQHQSSLATYCRTGDLVDIKGAVQKNLTHYRRLVFNNVLDTLETAYPVAKNLLGDDHWENIVNCFFSTYNIQSPQIWRMPEEFKNYLIKQEDELLKTYPFLENLLEFEWLEVEIFMMPDVPYEKPKDGFYVLNPEIDILMLSYPVHIKSPHLITEEDRGSYFVSLHRNPDTGSVQFTNLSIPFVDVLEHLSANPLTEQNIKQILKKYASENDVNVAFKEFIEQSLVTQLLFK